MRAFVIALVFAAAQAMPAIDDGFSGSVVGVVKDCSDGNVALCLKVISDVICDCDPESYWFL